MDAKPAALRLASFANLSVCANVASAGAFLAFGQTGGRAAPFPMTTMLDADKMRMSNFRQDIIFRGDRAELRLAPPSASTDSEVTLKAAKRASMFPKVFASWRWTATRREGQRLF
jgi:hypothetical protein